MKRLVPLLLLLLGLLAVPSARAQFTTVTGTVVDQNNQVYQNCHGEADFVPASTATTQPFLSGSLFQTSVVINQCDGTGTFTIVLADNNQVSDGHTGTGSQWRFTLCSVTVPQICFTYTTTITGATQNISAGLKAASALLPLSVAGNIALGTIGNLAKYGTVSNLADSGIAATNVPLLNGNNALTGNETHAGTETFSGTEVITGPVSGTRADSGNIAYTGNNTHSTGTETFAEGLQATPLVQFQGADNTGLRMTDTTSPGTPGGSQNIFFYQHDSAGTLVLDTDFQTGCPVITAGALQCQASFTSPINSINRNLSFGGILGGGSTTYYVVGDLLGYWSLGFPGYGWSTLRMENQFDAATPPSIEVRDTGQALPAGLFRITSSGNQFYIQHNTGVQFSSSTSPLILDANDKIRANVGFLGGLYGTLTNCAAVGTAASPSVASCAVASAGHFSCATNATGATCQVNTTAVTANSEILVFESDTAATGTALGVTCNTSTTVIPTSRILASYIAGASFTINLGTVTTNPACFSYQIIN